MTLAITLVLAGYLMGSICSAIIVCRIFNLPDPREEGSKNPGATNVLRIAGKQYAALVLVVDLLKGTIPVVVAKALGVPPAVAALTVLAAVLGHMYPIFFNFKGGKGVATAIGALLGLHFILGVMVVATWLLVVNFFRYSSLASIVAIALSPLYALLMTHDLTVFTPILLMAILVLFKHAHNFNRLIDGSEPKVFIKENVLKEVLVDSESQNRFAANEELEEKPVQSKITPIKKAAKTIDVQAKAKRATSKKTDTSAAPTKKKTESSAKKVDPKAKSRDPENKL